jgi:hypothetical protein
MARTMTELWECGRQVETACSVFLIWLGASVGMITSLGSISIPSSSSKTHTQSIGFTFAKLSAMRYCYVLVIRH